MVDDDPSNGARALFSSAELPYRKTQCKNPIVRAPRATGFREMLVEEQGRQLRSQLAKREQSLAPRGDPVRFLFQ
jgi:hypothetical protein